MDFGGVLSMDGFSSSSSCLKHGRSDGDFEETQDLGFAKMARTESKDGYRRPATQSLFPEGAQMLSFSTPVKDINGASLPYCYYPYQSVNELSMNNNGVTGRVRGPFTPSQWMELEHQALIYKYIVQNAPVPTTLLWPIRRSLNSSSLFSPYSSFTSAPLGWGSLQVGYPYNSDPEPGRCRRTDGKKWRCSRDAVPDQKYCERHINRGRHRSRKHVEPQRSTPAPAATRAGGGGGRGGGGSLPDSNLNRILTKETTMTNPTKNPFEHTNAWIQQSRPNTTNLSIAIPVCSFDFSSSASPNNRDNMTLTPLNWGASLGGPLGEVLNNTSNNSYGNDVNIDVSKDDHSRSYALPPSLDLLRDGWDLDLGHNLGSSPTDVLKNNFGSVSSSNASSPRPEIGAVCHDLIGSAVTKPHSITLL